jgi:hypothetical protein
MGAGNSGRLRLLAVGCCRWMLELCLMISSVLDGLGSSAESRGATEPRRSISSGARGRSRNGHNGRKPEQMARCRVSCDILTATGVGERDVSPTWPQRGPSPGREGRLIQSDRVGLSECNRCRDQIPQTCGSYPNSSVISDPRAIGSFGVGAMLTALAGQSDREPARLRWRS